MSVRSRSAPGRGEKPQVAVANVETWPRFGSVSQDHWRLTRSNLQRSGRTQRPGRRRAGSPEGTYPDERDGEKAVGVALVTDRDLGVDALVARAQHLGRGNEGARLARLQAVVG